MRIEEVKGRDEWLQRLRVSLPLVTLLRSPASTGKRTVAECVVRSAGVTGSDAAWPADGEEDEWAKQLGYPVTQLVATADANTIQIQNTVIWRPVGRYVVPIVDNNMSQAVRDEATATNNDSRVILVPRRFLIQDTA